MSVFLTWLSDWSPEARLAGAFLLYANEATNAKKLAMTHNNKCTWLWFAGVEITSGAMPHWPGQRTCSREHINSLRN